MKTKTAKVSPAQLTTYFRLNRERLRLQSKANAIDKRLGIMREQFATHLKKSRLRSMVIGAFVILFEKFAARVSWKEEFIRVTSAAAASKIAAAQKKVDCLVVRKIQA